MKIILAITRAFLLAMHTAVHIMVLGIHSYFYKGVDDDLGFRYRGLWARRACKLLGIRIDELIDHKTNETVLYVSNHRTMTDPIVQAGFFKSYIIAKDEVGSIPIIGRGAEMTGVILVKRGQLGSRVEARNKTRELLEEGRSVLVYAEGTTTAGEKTGNFKIGTFKAAVELGVPVVPIAIEYRDHKDFWIESSLARQLINQIGSWNTHVKLRMGAPITMTDPRELKSNVQNWIDHNLAEMQNDWSNVFSS